MEHARAFFFEPLTELQEPNSVLIGFYTATSLGQAFGAYIAGAVVLAFGSWVCFERHTNRLYIAALAQRPHGGL